MATAALAPAGHVRLSASSAHRWIHCAGSVAASAGLPDGSSKHADEGSAAHLLASSCLEQNTDAADLLGVAFDLWPDFPVTDDMATHVQTYLDYVRGLWAFCDERWIESKSAVLDHFAKLPEEVGGTSDAGGIDYAARMLHIADLKFGRGVVVEIEDNEQFLIYALGKYGDLSHEDRMRLAHVTMHVIQPRAAHDDGPIRTWTISIVDLLNWAKDTLSPAAFAALKTDAPRTAGEHCRWCKAKPTCATFRDRAFASMPFTFEEVGNKALLPVLPTAEVTALSPERASEIYFALDKFEEWASAYRGFIFAAMQSGVAFPGIGMKRKRTNRAWMEESMVRDWFAQEGCAVAAEKSALRSVADLEKECKKVKMPFPEHLVTKAEGELTLCASSDKEVLAAPLTVAAHFTTEEL